MKLALLVLLFTPADEGSASSDPSTRPDARAARRERAEEVAEAVASLPANQRGVVLLRHFEGLSYAEIAEVLGTSTSAVESLLFRARKTLAERITPEPEVSPQVSVGRRVQ